MNIKRNHDFRSQLVQRLLWKSTNTLRLIRIPSFSFLIHSHTYKHPQISWRWAVRGADWNMYMRQSKGKNWVFSSSVQRLRLGKNWLYIQHTTRLLEKCGRACIRQMCKGIVADNDNNDDISPPLRTLSCIRTSISTRCGLLHRIRPNDVIVYAITKQLFCSWTFVLVPVLLANALKSINASNISHSLSLSLRIFDYDCGFLHMLNTIQYFLNFSDQIDSGKVADQKSMFHFGIYRKKNISLLICLNLKMNKRRWFWNSI